MTSNRISFALGLNGMSYNIDSGDTGSGSALEKGFRMIKKGFCDAAIVVGVAECLHPHLSYQLKQLGKLMTDAFIN